MSSIALTARELEEQLVKRLDPVLSLRRTAGGAARSLARLPRHQQDFVLHWVSVGVKTNSEMGYQFAAHAARAFELMDRQHVESWLLGALDRYDKEGLYPGCAELQDVERYARYAVRGTSDVAFEEVAGVLQRFAVGLSGRKLKVAAGGAAYTDTQVLYVPERISVFDDRQANFQLYKSMVIYLWAQTRFGTFSGRPGMSHLREVIDALGGGERPLELFQALEAVRLNANIAGELPAMHKRMLVLQRTASGDVVHPPSWAPVIDRLNTLPNSVVDTCDALREVYESVADAPASFCFQGQIRISEAERRMQERQLEERKRFQIALAECGRGGGPVEPPRSAVGGDGPELRLRPVMDTGQVVDFELTVGAVPVAMSKKARLLAHSILQDFGEIPPGYLGNARDRAYDGNSRQGEPSGACEETGRSEGAFTYEEWDCRRQRYRTDWCVLRELDVHPVSTDFIAATLRKYAHLLFDLRKSFEALRGEEKILKRQRHGNDIDIDAVVEAFADSKAGMEMTDRLLVQSKKLDRDLAVAFMVDMSGSTKGWINNAEREALVLLCESLEILGDRYAIYGFSGMTRKRCELYRVKTFNEDYTDRVKQRISAIAPQDYTRMGVTIRHLTSLLRHIDARTKLMITLSDGKPDDYDGYRGEYGIEDTRRALMEAKSQGVQPFCITIDSEARDYLPHMYGAVNYVVVDEISKLPLKVAHIYRRITA